MNSPYITHTIPTDGTDEESADASNADVSFIDPGSSSCMDDSNTSTDFAVQLILNQLWDIIESPNFQIVLQQAIDICFQRIFEQLKLNAFESGSGRKTPPLALLLPQFKQLVSVHLLPVDMNTLSRIANEISNLPSLDALCVLAYDSMRPC